MIIRGEFFKTMQEGPPWIYEIILKSDKDYEEAERQLKGVGVETKKAQFLGHLTMTMHGPEDWERVGETSLSLTPFEPNS